MLRKKVLITLLMVIISSFTLISCNVEAPEKDVVQSPENPNEEESQKQIREIEGLLQNAEKMIREKKWSEAGSYLLQAKEMSKESILQVKHPSDYNIYPPVEDEIIKALAGGFVFTKEDARLFMDQPQFKKPEEPKIEVLGRDGREVLNWFANYRSWYLSMVVIPGDYYFDTRPEGSEVILFLGDSLEELTDIRQKYLKEGYDEYRDMGSYWVKIGGETFYYSLAGGFGLEDGFLELSSPTNDILDFKISDNEVYFKISNNASGGVLLEGVYDVTYEIERREDGTFRVGDYKYSREE